MRKITFRRAFYLPPRERFGRILNAAGKLCSMQQSSAHIIHTSSWQYGELCINPIALSYFRPLRNRDGYNAARWRDTDKRLARSRRYHPFVAFTPRAIPRRFHTVNRHCGTGTFLLFYPRRFLAKRKTSGIKRCSLNAGWTYQ